MIIDSGVLFAAADRDAPNHLGAVSAIESPGVKIVPEPVVAEVAYLIGRDLGAQAEVAFTRSLDQGVLTVECPGKPDRQRAAELMERYADAPIGYVDAVVVAMAERLEEDTIATLDERHFSMIRPRHIAAFRLVP